MKRAIKKYAPAFAAIIGLVVISAAVTVTILREQRLRFPIVDPKPFRLNAELDTAQAVTPGQGQTVQVAGVKIGDIGEVKLRNGRAIVALDLEPKYKDLIHTDATATLRPRTGLKDMYIQVDPGTDSAPLMKEGDTIPIGATFSDVNLDEIIATLDGDTRDYLRLLASGAGRGLQNNGDDLAEVFRRFAPTFRDLARVNKAVAEEDEAIKDAIHSLAVLNERLAERAPDLRSLVDASSATFEAIASEDQNLQSTVRELAPTLRQATTTLAAVRPLAEQLGPTAERLRPVFTTLDETNRVVTPIARTLTPIVRDEIRPFTRAARPLVRDLRPAARGLNRTAPDLTQVTRVLNVFFNMLGYNDRGREGPGTSDRSEGYLFSLAWATHQGVNLFNVDDANGPLRPIFLAGTCQTLVSLVRGEPEAEALLGLSDLLASACNNPSTASIDVERAERLVEKAQKARKREAAKQRETRAASAPAPAGGGAAAADDVLDTAGRTVRGVTETAGEALGSARGRELGSAAREAAGLLDSLGGLLGGGGGK